MWNERGAAYDARLLSPFRLAKGAVTVGDALAAAEKQTEVKLLALEPELQHQKVTLFLVDLKLYEFMARLADLLGLYWYYRADGGVREYVVAYGSTGPGEAGQPRLSQRQRYWQGVRASRAADAIRAADLTDAQLRELGQTDPSLAGAMLQSIGSRYAARILAGLPPQEARALVDRGAVTVSAERLPAWFVGGLRTSFDPGEWTSFGIASADDLVKRIAVEVTSEERLFGEQDGPVYAMWGPMWPGIFCRPVVLPAGENGGSATPTYLSFYPFIAGHPRSGAGGWLPGKMEDRTRAEKLFPELKASGPRELPSEAMWPLFREVERRLEEEVATSPWGEDAELSTLPAFVLEPGSRTTKILAAIATQTGYSVVGTYYEDVDQPVSDVSAREPLYVLLNRMARKTECRWGLAGRVITWRYQDWFLREAGLTPTGVGPGRTAPDRPVAP